MRALLLFLIIGTLSACAGPRPDDVRSARLVDLHTQLGAGYLQRNQLEVAAEELEQALAIDPRHGQANSMMALVQAQLKNAARADRHFRRALAAQPNNGEVQNNYGFFLCERGEIDKAVERFVKALADPTYKTPELANLNAGLCLMKKPAPTAAADYFRAALALQPRLAPALYQMAKISFDSGQTLSARGYMQRYFEVAGDSAESLGLAITIERALGNKDLQANYALRLRAKYPDSPQAKALKAASGRERQ